MEPPGELVQCESDPDSLERELPSSPQGVLCWWSSEQTWTVQDVEDYQGQNHLCLTTLFAAVDPQL